MSKKVSIPLFVLLLALVLMPSTASARGHWSFGVFVGPPAYGYYPYYPPPPVVYDYPYPYYPYYYPYYRPYRYYNYGFGWRGGARFERRGRVVHESRRRVRR